ncbi:phosphoglycerate dehydrogenase-like enzyme [Bradyrhizobium sp. LB14.3]|uniref:NAD(P)-dependent oxidoreductase n=1 Tax=Bradyrhizobium sp. LB14.3 TaxID=3156328 RepID=UPI003396499F
MVTNARGVHGDSIADFVMTGIGMMHWDFPRFMQEQSRKEWHTRPVPPISQKTLGVVGLGSIGAAIARRGKGAGMTVLGTKRTGSAIAMQCIHVKPKGPNRTVDWQITPLFPPNGDAQ